LAQQNIDGESSVVVQHENVSTQVCESDAVLVIEIKGGEKQSSFRFDLKDELLFPMNLDDAISAAKNIRTDTEFESRLGKDASRYRMTRGLGSAKRHRVIHFNNLEP
jgi:hypothetical protein